MKLNLFARAGAGAAALIWAGAALAQTAFAPAAIVNDDPITYFDIEQRAAILTVGGAEPGPQLNAAALEQLITDRLRVQAGEVGGVGASGDEIAGAATELAQRQGLDRAGLVERIVRGGATEDALIDLLTAQVIWRKVVNARFSARATPSEGDLDQEIALAAAGETLAFRIAEIAIPFSQGQEEQVRQVMNEVKSRLDAGGDFSALARQFSRAPTAAQGGDAGWIPEAALPGNISEALRALQPGQYTLPLPVPGGVSILLLRDTRSEAPEFARAAEVELLRVSVAVPEGADEEAVRAAQAEAERLGDEMRSCEGAPVLNANAAMERLPQSPLITLPNNIQDAVRLLAPQQASRAIRNDQSLDVFVVCDREGGVDQQARDRLREQIRTTRLTRLAEGFMQELRREAVIERR